MDFYGDGLENGRKTETLLQNKTYNSNATNITKFVYQFLFDLY